MSNSNTNSTKKVEIEREYLTAVSINAGIITLIEPNGNIGYYRQRNIQNLGVQKRACLVKIGALNKDWAKYKELPRNYSISYEEPEIQGRALASFTDKYADAAIKYARSRGLKI